MLMGQYEGVMLTDVAKGPPRSHMLGIFVGAYFMVLSSTKPRGWAEVWDVG